MSIRSLLSLAFAASCAVATPVAWADGMQPQTSIVILYEEEGETSMNVRNTDDAPALLYTVVQDVPDDPGFTVIATPPVARVEPGQEQMVRFIYEGEPLQTQRLKRVIFEGIGQARKPDGRAVVGVNVRQNLPLLVHPKGLPRNNAPWKLLQWTHDGKQLTVRNDSRYVVRLGQEVMLLPSGTTADVGRTYLLPGQTFTIDAAGAAGDASVRLQPATVYGFAVAHYDAPLH